MAELPKNIRKPGGALVSARSPFTRRVLLPTEADLCNALGIKEDEYFQFLEGVAAKVKERPEAYDLVPNLVNGTADSPLSPNLFKFLSVTSNFGMSPSSSNASAINLIVLSAGI